jgi:hypothetical protein
MSDKGVFSSLIKNNNLGSLPIYISTDRANSSLPVPGIIQYSDSGLTAFNFNG